MEFLLLRIFSNLHQIWQCHQKSNQKNPESEASEQEVSLYLSSGFDSDTKLGSHLQNHDLRPCNRFCDSATYWLKVSKTSPECFYLSAIFASPPHPPDTCLQSTPKIAEAAAAVQPCCPFLLQSENFTNARGQNRQIRKSTNHS